MSGQFARSLHGSNATAVYRIFFSWRWWWWRKEDDDVQAILLPP